MSVKAFPQDKKAFTKYRYDERTIPKRHELVKGPKKVETYKSIFTSHTSAKRSKEESAHWVTHTSYCF
ncbi:UPF0549 protein C20orf43-like [Cricetulus griseus]|uniref:Putative UPF0549 protein C20orf43 like protein n=1 Tax=Cricetulus griseus TaxID=10029 RepID=G3I8V6_CRIGR|nr:UPF0549 protein C20orf43-like [Cricetulus griseus]ERE82941.1 putative UPF0549 protein C20orf43 like protein [Cricetulus griseus]